ncbi:hypothetical protein ACWCPM_07575 [Streptomyces sp. NPDC002309]
MNDDELLARLRAADPALTPRAPLFDIDRLVEAALNTDNTPQSERTTSDVTARPAKAVAGRGRRNLFALAAVAALLMVGGGIAGGVMVKGDGGDSSGPVSASEPLTLTAASGTGRARCVEPTPEALSQYPTVFEGTVTSVEGSSVFFRVDDWFEGAGSETVRLNHDADAPESLTFLVGEPYIVAATKDGTVEQCGANMASDETRAQFRKAYDK